MKTFPQQLLATLGAAGLLILGPAAPMAVHAQARNLNDWAWVTRLGATTLPGSGNQQFPPSVDQPESLAADAAGNVVIAGVYNPDVIFDSPAVRYQTSTGPAGPIDNSYVAKYNPNGSLLWSLDLTSTGDVHVRDLAVDALGNIYVLGYYYQQFRINAVVAAVANTRTPHFLAKISPAGTLVWATTIEPDALAPTTSLNLQRLAVDAAGNSVVLGRFRGEVTINGTAFAGDANKLHVLVMRYNPTGTPIDAFAGYVTAGADIDLKFTGVALAATREVYLGGYLSPAARVQFGSLPALTGPATGNAAGFVVKFGNTGANWITKTTGPGSQSVSALTIGPQNRCVVAGLVTGSAMGLGTQRLNTGNPAGTSGEDLFLARLAPDGTVEQLVGGGGRSSDIRGLAVGPQGEATIAVAGGLDWGNVRLPGAPWPASALAGLVRLDASGVPQRGWQAGTALISTALAVDGFNQPILAGTCNSSSPYTFGTRQLTVPYAFNTVIARTGSTLLSARQPAQVAGLEVYPNPARQVVEVRTATMGLVQVQIFDAVGRRVCTQALVAGETRVTLAGLAPGSYTMLVAQGDARGFRHLTVQP